VLASQVGSSPGLHEGLFPTQPLGAETTTEFVSIQKRVILSRDIPSFLNESVPLFSGQSAFFRAGRSIMKICHHAAGFTKPEVLDLLFFVGVNIFVYQGRILFFSSPPNRQVSPPFKGMVYVSVPRDQRLLRSPFRMDDRILGPPSCPPQPTNSYSFFRCKLARVCCLFSLPMSSSFSFA